MLQGKTTQHDDGSSEVRRLAARINSAPSNLINFRRRHFMVTTRFRTVASTALAVSVLLISASMALSQSPTTSSSNSRTVASGQKMKIKGVVVRRDADTFVIRDANGVDTTVRLSDSTSVKSNGGFLRSGTNYAQTNILRGLNLEVEGRGGSSGELVADSVRFNETDFR